ncbi:MHYT domain-containing protein [Sulfitobacter maritimus]|uniref:sensor histidine kinase n=1 Tax=Sulfitobacter maritimus TaxID=2741719 RepID=UPI001FEB7472|nr:MHYT domain-containing protein [Sulfitobacter maritimus]
MSWYFLTAMTAGVTIWCTHFIAILAYQLDAPASFHLSLTFASLIIAILGSTVGIVVAGTSGGGFRMALGGVIFGLAISAMHYTGMVAYRVQGVISWDLFYLFLSVVFATTLSVAALYLACRGGRFSALKMTGMMTAAILALHFTGMAAFQVTPLKVNSTYDNPAEYTLIALIVAGTALIIVLAALFSHFVENRTRNESIEELRKARDAAESASRAKSEFMSVLSHELRTPLTIVIGYATFMAKLKNHTSSKIGPDEIISAKHFENIGDQAELYGERIKSAGGHLLSIINDILDYTSMELNNLALNKAPFSARTLLDEVADQFQGMAREKGATLHVQSPDLTLIADRSRSLQILINLVGNALKFSKATEIHLRGRAVTDGFCFEVADNGSGIAPQNLERIFDAFTQVEDAEDRAEGGTGLGLAICKKLALGHGGDITVESTLGRGTTFTVMFPSPIAEAKAPVLSAAA